MSQTPDTPNTPQEKNAEFMCCTVTWGIGPELAVMAKDRVAANFAVPMIGGWTLSMSAFVDGAGKAGDGVAMPATFVQESLKNARMVAESKRRGIPKIGHATLIDRMLTDPGSDPDLTFRSGMTLEQIRDQFERLREKARNGTLN